MRGTGRRKALLPGLAGVLLPLAWGCSTPGVAVQEYDALLLPPKGSSALEPLRYGRWTRRYPWLFRQFEGTGVDWLFVNLLSLRPRPSYVRHPLEFAGRRLQVMGRAALPEEVREASLRLMLAAFQDPWRLNRVRALQSLKEIALRIGPGPAPPAERAQDPPKPPLLDEAFRKRLARESARGEWGTLREAVRKTFLAALTDTRQVVRTEAVQGAYDLWGVEGLRTAVLVHMKWGPPVWSPQVIRKAAFLCRGALPGQARNRKGGPSLFDILHQWMARLPSEELVLDCREAVCAVLGIPPRYDRAFFEKWWEKETGSREPSRRKEESGS